MIINEMVVVKEVRRTDKSINNLYYNVHIKIICIYH